MSREDIEYHGAVFWYNVASRYLEMLLKKTPPEDGANKCVRPSE